MNERAGSHMGDIIKNLIFPPRCFFCGRLVEWDEAFCSECASLAKSENHTEEGEFGCEAICWGAPYSGELRAGMERFKFRGVRRGKEIFGQMLLEALTAADPTFTVDAVTYVPMPRARERSRGYNQAKLLAEYLSCELGLPLREGLLCRKTRREMHRARSGSERQDIAAGSYCIGKAAPDPGERLLLVDDIITTGATLTVCAALLRQSGASAVWGAAPLRTPRVPPAEEL